MSRLVVLDHAVDPPHVRPSAARHLRRHSGIAIGAVFRVVALGQHSLIQTGHAGNRTDGQGPAVLLVGGEIDRVGQIGGIGDAVDLPRQAAILDRRQHGREHLVAKEIHVGMTEVVGRPQRQVNDVARGDMTKMDELVGDGLRGPTVGVDHDGDVLRPAASKGAGGQQGNQQQRNSKVLHRKAPTNCLKTKANRGLAPVQVSRTRNIRTADFKSSEIHPKVGRLSGSVFCTSAICG